jgi:RsiW-degrading membrane proteinase PrsW (M82 family)
VLALGIVFGQRFLKATITDTQRGAIAVALAIMPISLWLVFSYWGERRAVQPRQHIGIVVLLSALVANAVGIPLVERFFTIDAWLSTASGSTRILGYTLTGGIVQEFLKYAVIRYSFWPQDFHTRSDGIAYATAAAVGYATALNLNYAFSTNADPAASALRIVEFTLPQIAISTIMGYFLAELKISRDAGIFWLPGGLLLASFLAGLSIAFRGGLVVGSISTTSNASNPLQGLGIAIFLVIALFASVYFLINNADERAHLRGRPEFAQ